MTRTDLKPYCIEIETKDKTYFIQLKNDEELYGWMDDVYSRSPLMGVSSPTNFVHQVHVGFDPISGAFTGLPEQWTKLLTTSAITKEDYVKNPQAVLDVLEFYTDIQKRERDDFGLGTPTMNLKPGAVSASASGARFGGTGYAGSQQAQQQQPQQQSPYQQQQQQGGYSSGGAPLKQTTSGNSGGYGSSSSQHHQQQSNDLWNSNQQSGSKSASPYTSASSSTRPSQDLAKRPDVSRQQGERERSATNTSTTSSNLSSSGGGGGGLSSNSAGSQQQRDLGRAASPSPRPTNPPAPVIKDRDLVAGRAAPAAPGASSNGGFSRSGAPSGPRISPSSSAAAGLSQSSATSSASAAAATRDKEVAALNLKAKEMKIAEDNKKQQQAAAAAAASAAHKEVKATRQAPAAPPAASSGASSAVKPLQTTKKAEPAAAAAAPSASSKKEDQRRISTMTEAQIMEKLRSVVSPEDPNTLYSKIKKVGQGASGSVYVAKTLATGQRVAIKTMDLAQQPRKELIVNEILVMKESQHPNIVNFLDSYLVKNNELWVIMEFMEGGALTDVIDNNTLEEDQIAAICFETCKGLEHLHAQSIIHRDIKSDNVLLNAQGQVKISESRLIASVSPLRR